MTKVHLYNDLKIRKHAIKKEITEYLDMIGGSEEADERGLTQAAELINRRTQIYTPEEAECLIAWYTSSHDDCVLDNPEDFHPLQVHVAQEKMDRMESALKFINNLK